MMIACRLVTASFLAFFCFANPIARAEVSDPFSAITGDWATEGYGAVVRMDVCAGRPDELCGELIWAWEPDDLKPGSVGSLMFEGAAFDGEMWIGGRLHNPEDGRIYRGSIAQTGPDTLKLRGCAARVFCRTQTWRRLQSLPHIAGM
ncbi:MAG: DUF2147 domain-containing protein [Pseudomonadota bacterium]